MARLVLLLALVGCRPDIQISDIEAELSPEIPTVITVRWSTDLPSLGFVRFWEPDGPVHTTATETAEALDHEALLLGMPANTEVGFEIVALADSAGESLAMGEPVTTGFLPPELPSLTVTGDMGAYMVTPLLGDPIGAVILDGQGRYVWWHLFESERDTYRALLSVDGESVLFNEANIDTPSPDSVVQRVALDGSAVERIPVPYLAHDIVELPDGTIGAIASYSEDKVKGDAIVEVAPDGTLSTVWTAFDCFDPETDIGDDQQYGWTWANALDYDPAHDCYYISLRNFSTVVQVFRDGTCGWAFGWVGATIEPASGSGRFMHSHQFEVANGRFRVFDNEGSDDPYSRVLEYDFDPDAGRAEQIWEYSAGVSTFVLGDLHRLDDGDTLVTWSVNGLIQRVSPAGEVKGQIEAPFNHPFGFNQVREDLYAQDD
ncbi:MAG: aryl-sulfate sulfotransferase [Pseudomonadota bacterium]